MLTSLITPPDWLVYLSSDMQAKGDASLRDLTWQERPWNATQVYCDSKLYDVMLAFAVARRWPEVLANALNPGWVPTKWVAPMLPTA